jgi:hypothetical protein
VNLVTIARRWAIGQQPQDREHAGDVVIAMSMRERGEVHLRGGLEQRRRAAKATVSLRS